MTYLKRCLVNSKNLTIFLLFHFISSIYFYSKTTTYHVFKLSFKCIRFPLHWINQTSNINIEEELNDKLLFSLYLVIKEYEKLIYRSLLYLFIIVCGFVRKRSKVFTPFIYKFKLISTKTNIYLLTSFVGFR